MTELVKVETICPVEEAENLRLEIGKAGGGCIDDYHYTAFVTVGKGYFMPMKGSNPTIGKIGTISEVDEAKIEFFCEKNKLDKVIKKIKEVHSYEKPWIAVYGVEFRGFP